METARSLRYVFARTVGPAVRTQVARGILVPSLVLAALGGVAASPVHVSSGHVHSGVALTRFCKVGSRPWMLAPPAVRTGPSMLTSPNIRARPWMLTPWMLTSPEIRTGPWMLTPWMLTPTVIRTRPWMLGVTVGSGLVVHRSPDSLRAGAICRNVGAPATS